MTCIAIQLLMQMLLLKAKLHLESPHNFGFIRSPMVLLFRSMYCGNFADFDTIPMQFGDEENLISDFLEGILSGFGLGGSCRSAWDEP